MSARYARILPTLPLYQGDALAAAEAGGRFDVLVVAAQELRPFETLVKALAPHRLTVLDAGIDDSDLTPREARVAGDAAWYVAEALGRRRRVLVACFAGRNRSGLVTGLVLKRIGYSADQAIRLIREARGESALSNPSFVRYLEAK